MTLRRLGSPAFSSSERRLAAGSGVAEGAREFPPILGDRRFVGMGIVSSVVDGGERRSAEGGELAGGGRRLLLEAINFVA